jgi:hypothetical protein
LLHAPRPLQICGHQTDELPGVDLPPITIARNIKELCAEAFPTPLGAHLGFSPFALSRLLARDDAPTKEVHLGGAGASVTLGWERFLVAEMLFADEGGGAGLGEGGALQHAVMHAVYAAAEQAAAQHLPLMAMASS